MPYTSRRRVSPPLHETMMGGNMTARLLIATIACLGAGLAAAQGFPAKPIRVIVPFPPGGPSDYVGRLTAQKLAETIGQQVIVDNRSGAGGALGTELAARAAPDGYTLIIVNTGTVTVLPHLMSKLPYNPQRDFAPITNVMGGPSYLLVHPSVPARNLKELIALAKARPGQITYASAGMGQISHMNGELLRLLAGIDLLHVPYKGTGPIMPEVLGGQVSVTFSTSIDTVQFAKAGRVRLLAVTGKERLANVPDTPTMEEAGLPGFESLNWNGLAAPAGTPREIVQRLQRELAKGLASPDIKEKVAALGNFVIADTPEQFAAFIRSDFDKWGKVVKAAGIKVE